VTSSPTPGLFDALRAILRPLVRLMVARGVTLPALTVLLKQLFVDVAARDFRLGGKPASDSRISVLTGVHRKDVRAIRDHAAPLSQPRPGGLGATVVGRWLGDAQWQDDAGRPSTLPRHAPPGQPSFERLVAGISTDVRPRTVLDELVRQGLVAHDPATDTVQLLAEAFVPREGEAAMLGFMQQNLHDHIAAAAANLLAAPDAPRRLERAVFYNNLPGADVDRLEAEARTLALAALRHLNSLALEAQQAGHESPAPKERFRFGVYFWREPIGPPDPPDSGAER
jgi:hypothetical protein